MPPRLTRALDQAIALFLSTPLSEDTHGYAHFIPVEYFETLRGAFLNAVSRRAAAPASRSTRAAPTPQDSGIRETVLMRLIRQNSRRSPAPACHRLPHHLPVPPGSLGTELAGGKAVAATASEYLPAAGE